MMQTARAGLGVLLLLLPASHVAAQTRNQTSVGYSAMRADGVNLPVGWNVSLATGAGSLMAVLDVTGQHKGDDDGLLALQGGVRFAPPRAGRVAPFGQALFGFAFTGISGALVVQFGGGVDVSTRVGAPTLRLGLDIPVFFNSDEAFAGIRATAGIVFNR